MVGIRSILVGVMLVASAAMARAQTWTVTTADFEVLQGDIRAVDAAGVRVQAGGAEGAEGAERALPWEQVVSVDQPGVKMTLGADPFVLVTRDGQRIAGSPVRLGDEKLAWRSQMLGAVELPIEEVAGIVQLSSESLPEGAGQEDLVVLANGDQLRGIIEADADGGIQVQQQGKAAKVQWDSVKAIVLAQVGEAAGRGPAEAGKLRIRLTDGSVCRARQLHRDGEQLHIQREAGELKLPLAAIVSVENEGGKVRFLSAMKPQESRYAPYMQISDQQPSPLKVLDEVTIDGRPYRGVLQVRPKTLLTYTSSTEGKLHLRYACAQPGEMTNMALKVLVNGKPVHEKQDVSSASPGEAVEAPIKAGDAVTIEVDYGRNFDVQDWLLLLEAAFVAK